MCYPFRASSYLILTHSAKISSFHLFCNVQLHKTKSIICCSNVLPWFHFVVSVHNFHWSLQIWWFLLLSTHPSYIWTCAAVWCLCDCEYWSSPVSLLEYSLFPWLFSFLFFCVTCARFNASFGFFLFLLVFCLIQEFFQRFLQHSFLVGFYLKIWIGKTSCLYYNPFTHFWYSAFIDKTLVRNTSYT